MKYTLENFKRNSLEQKIIFEINKVELSAINLSKIKFAYYSGTLSKWYHYNKKYNVIIMFTDNTKVMITCGKLKEIEFIIKTLNQLL